jgi:hypothetical protein
MLAYPSRRQPCAIFLTLLLLAACETPSGGNPPASIAEQDPLPLETFEPMTQVFGLDFSVPSPFPSYRLLFGNRGESCELVANTHLGLPPALIEVQLPHLSMGQFVLSPQDNITELSAHALPSGAPYGLRAVAQHGWIEIDRFDAETVEGRLSLDFPAEPRVLVHLSWEQTGTRWRGTCDCLGLDGVVATFESEDENLDCCNQFPGSVTVTFDFAASRCDFLDLCYPGSCPGARPAPAGEAETVCAVACEKLESICLTCTAPNQLRWCGGDIQRTRCLERCRSEYDFVEVQTIMGCATSSSDCRRLTACLDSPPGGDL